MTDDMTYRGEVPQRTYRQGEEPVPIDRAEPELIGPEGGLFGSERREDLRHRWLEIQSLFVDEPQRAVASAEDLVREALSSLSDRFEQSRHLNRETPEGQASTEALRRAFQSYRSFFDRLVAL